METNLKQMDILSKYNSEVFMKPIWSGDTVYHEAVMFADTADGYVQKAKKLLYPIDEIICVKNNNLDKDYVQDVDFKVENGKLVWLENGSCPIWRGYFTVPIDANDSYVDPKLSTGTSATAASWYRLEENGDKGLNLIYDSYHEDCTVYVTYKYSKCWSDLNEEGYTPIAPKNKSSKIKYFYEKLATGQEVNVLVHGDSTATGCTSTGANVTYELFGKVADNQGNYTVTNKGDGYGIKAPTFFEQAVNHIVKKFGNNNEINYYNISLGGSGARWGIENLSPRINFLNKHYGKTIIPDIIFIKYFANDVRTTPESFKQSFEGMVETFKKLYPEALIVIVSGKVNNEKCYIFRNARENILKLQQVLCDIENKYDNCVVAEATPVWESIIKSKDVEDYLSNNINHANDFWAKTMAQIITATIEKA